MDYKKVIFAGFFLNNEEKFKFTRLFQSDQKIFLESSKEFSKYDSEFIKFFPMNIFHMQNNRIWNLLFNRVELDPIFIDLYRKDLKVFKHTYMKDPLPGGKKTYFFFVYWVLRKLFKSKINSTNILDACRMLLKKGESQNELGYMGRKDTYHYMAELKLLAFRLAFINGYIYIKKMADQLDAGKEDLLVLWGSHNSGVRLLKEALEDKGVTCLISEYGELPGTFSLNKEGIFGDSEIAKSWDEIRAKKNSDNAILDAKKYLERVESSQSSSRGSSIDDQMLSFYRSIFQAKESTKKVIYVSGVELIASGHLFNKEFVTPSLANANEMLLNHVLSHFSSEEYTIFYKDHPLMQENYPELALNAADFNGVIFVNSMNVDNLISMADVTISLPSKVIMTCLMYRKPVYAFGDFSIPETVPELGYYTGRNVADIKPILDEGKSNIDYDLYSEIVSEFQNYLICNSELFESYNFTAEKSKVDNIIDSQLRTGN